MERMNMYLENFIQEKKLDDNGYSPFHDYFGLSTHVSGHHSPGNSSTYSSSPQSLSPFNDVAPNYLGFGNFPTPGPVTDPLEELRCDAQNDFLKNGIECDLDEWDKCQARLRGHNLTDRVPLTVEFEGNDKVFEYLLVKERKRAKSMKPSKSGQTDFLIF
ncbi:hypothetical protein LOTGIDRAFT_159670 [Lottia gigantea]|uniref:Uncharacterized protein n=1 Tax=Lottia gigantea TaxID=225164 RepID=V4AIS8_LOTGI|nr:hypothetical protein LOTGIDRAFT_159670 [Lottia gigantea]ESO96917.1 hypothetical protein LOTGIDRAFT_159670 [Lottia gigantea]